MNNICRICNYENRIENSFCTQCGSKLTEKIEASPSLVHLNAEQTVRIYPMNGEKNTIGRDVENTVVLNDDQVSKHHAEIYKNEKRYWIEDLGSKNGVYLNGKRIHEPTPLLPGSLIKLGSTILRFEEKN